MLIEMPDSLIGNIAEPVKQKPEATSSEQIAPEALAARYIGGGLAA